MAFAMLPGLFKNGSKKNNTGTNGQPTGMSGDKIPKGFTSGGLQQFNPEQMELFKRLFSHLDSNSYLSNLAEGDEDTFNQIEAPALQQFSALQSGIANKFSGMGSGARRSSGFGQAQTGAAQDFAMQLQSQRQGLQRQAIQDLMGMSGSLLGQRPYEKFVSEKPMPFWQKLLLGAASGASAGLQSQVPGSGGSSGGMG